MSKRRRRANDDRSGDDRLREGKNDEPDPISPAAEVESEVVWLGTPDPSDPARLKVQILGSAHGPSILDFVSAYKPPETND